jgi:uncharacterized membrane protein YqgA involved in biofilm formation
MVLWGTIVNAAAIIVGGWIGSRIPSLPEGIRTTVMQGLGLATATLGLTMAFRWEHILVVITSLVAGGIAGELLQIEQRLQQFGSWLERKVQRSSSTHGGKASIAEGFVTTSLLYCVGSMAILGALDSGLRLNHDILFTKSMLDGFTAILFASTLGIGVMFSAVPVFLYQGLIALSASMLAVFIDTAQIDEMVADVTAVGGVLIVGIGLNILGIAKINIGNLLPSLFIAAAFIPFL